MPTARRDWINDLRESLYEAIANDSGFTGGDLTQVVLRALEGRLLTDIFEDVESSNTLTRHVSDEPPMLPFTEREGVEYMISCLVLIKQRSLDYLTAAQLVEKGGSGLPMGQRHTHWRKCGYPGNPVAYIEKDDVEYWTALPGPIQQSRRRARWGDPWSSMQWVTGLGQEPSSSSPGTPTNPVPMAAEYDPPTSWEAYRSDGNDSVGSSRPLSTFHMRPIVDALNAAAIQPDGNGEYYATAISDSNQCASGESTGTDCVPQQATR